MDPFSSERFELHEHKEMFLSVQNVLKTLKWNTRGREMFRFSRARTVSVIIIFNFIAVRSCSLFNFGFIRAISGLYWWQCANVLSHYSCHNMQYYDSCIMTIRINTFYVLSCRDSLRGRRVSPRLLTYPPPGGGGGTVPLHPTVRAQIPSGG